MSAPLTAGSVMRMFHNDTNQQPFVQLLDIKVINAAAPQAQARHRVIISDGQHYMQGMLATQLNEMVNSSQVCSLAPQRTLARPLACAASSLVGRTSGY